MAKRKTKLQLCFDEFNHKYFNNRLHDVELSWALAPVVDGEKVDGYCEHPYDLYKANKIVLARRLRKSAWMWKIVLIHEMNHLDMCLREVDRHYEHGPEFNAGMLRLAKAGALNGLW